MSDGISPDNARYLDESVRQGVYRDQDHALDEAIRLLRQRDQLRADVQAGVQQADQGELLPADEVFKRLEQRAREIEQSAGAS